MAQRQPNNANHRSYLNILSEYLKNTHKARLPITKFDASEINLYFDYLSEVRGNGPRTLNNTKIFLRSMLYVLKGRNIITHNPATEIEDLPITQGRYIIFTEVLVRKRMRSLSIATDSVKPTAAYSMPVRSMTRGWIWYSWKHTGNCNAYLAGADIYSLMLLNGHRDLQTTQIYLKALSLLVPEELKKMEW